MKVFYTIVSLFFLQSAICSAQNIGINSQGAAPHNSAMLDISSTTSGFLMPRMTTAQRNAIASPATGLQVFNTETGMVNTFDGSSWTGANRTNFVLVKSIADFPAPAGSEITLDANTYYQVNGQIDISPYYINLNGATLGGLDVAHDLVMSMVPGAIIRSVNKGVYLQTLGIVPLSSSTSAFDLSDATGVEACIFFPGVSVIELGATSKGVGQITGFRLVGLMNPYWQCASGLKLGGEMGRFLCTNPYVIGIVTGSALEFKSDLNVSVIDIANGQFSTTGVPAILNSGATIANGRLTSNYFSGMASPISGFSTKNSQWWMQNNNIIADSRVLGMMHITSPIENAAISSPVFQAVKGNYTGSTENEHFTQTNGQLNYTGIRKALVQVTATMSVTPSANQTMTVEFEIRKNGISITGSQQVMVLKGSDMYLPITLMGMTEVSLNDKIEIWGKSPAYSGWTVEKMMVTVR